MTTRTIKTNTKTKSVNKTGTTGIDELLVADIARTLAKQIDKKIFDKKYAPAREILKLVGAGAFLVAAVAVPNLPLALKPFLAKEQEYEPWKRFNIPYLKRTLKRLEEQKLIEFIQEGNVQIAKITEAGRSKILRFAIDEMTITKPKVWDGRWRLVSYDIPGSLRSQRDIFREYLVAWQFYPLHESVFLHAYPCKKEIVFLREYLGVGEFVRIFDVAGIENDQVFRDFFDV